MVKVVGKEVGPIGYGLMGKLRAPIDLPFLRPIGIDISRSQA